MRKYELNLFRIHAYHAASGGKYAFDPKNFPKSLDKFWNIGKEVDLEARERRMNLLKQKQQEYKESLKGG